MPQWARDCWYALETDACLVYFGCSESHSVVVSPFLFSACLQSLDGEAIADAERLLAIKTVKDEAQKRGESRVQPWHACKDKAFRKAKSTGVSKKVAAKKSGEWGEANKWVF